MSSTLGTIYIDGIASGIDTSSIIKQVEEVQRRPITLVENRKAAQVDRLTTYQSLTAKLLGLSTSASLLTSPGSILTYAATSSDSSALAVSVNGSAGPGNYDIVVKSLATSNKLSSAVIVDDNEPLGYEGDILINGTAITIDAEDDLNEVAFKINQAGTGVWATVIDYADNDHRLILTAQDTGAGSAIQLLDANSGSILEGLGLLNSTTSIKHALENGAQSDSLSSSSGPIGTVLGLTTAPSGTVNINGTDVDIDLATDTLQTIASRINSTVSGVTATVISTKEGNSYSYTLNIVGDSGTPTFTDDKNVLTTLGVLGKEVANEVRAAADAHLTVEGVDVTRSTNSISDLIGGVTLDLVKADVGKTITVTIQQDANATYKRVSSLISTYNSIIDDLYSGMSWDADTATGGKYFGDPTIMLLQHGLHSTVMAITAAHGGSMTLPSQLGLSTDASGHLVLDSDKFAAALWANPTGVANMFATSGDASNGQISYVSSTSKTVDSGPAGYAVEITQVAQKATATSATLATGITTNETLTFENVCTVQLTAGMTLDEATDQLNSRFQLYSLSISASVQGDQIVIEHDNYGANYRFRVKSNLNQGAGGLDIGGATMGTAATYTGVNVAGTINGEACTGSGRYLTGASGNATTDGLMIRVDATTSGSYGAVKVSQGIASRLQRYVETITNSKNGSVTVATKGIEKDITALSDEITRMEESIASYLEKLRSELLAMETAIAQAESMQTYITNQLKGLQTSYSGTSSS